MWRIKNSWYKMRKRDRIMLVIWMTTIVACLVYSLIVATTGYKAELTTVEHVIAECQHEAVSEICSILKTMYGEDSSIRYSFYKTLNCTEPLTLYLNNQEVQIWIESTSNDNTGEKIQLITGISSISITGILFFVAYFIVRAFKKNSYVATATIVNVLKEEYYDKHYREYRTTNVYEYEYRDRNYKSQTGRTKALMEYKIGDKFEIIYLANKPSKSINKFIFTFVRFIPYVLLFVFIMTCSIWLQTIFDIVR